MRDKDHMDLDLSTCARKHFRIGWLLLLVFLSLGLVLELLHAFKVGWYLDVSNATRRHMWTLAHSHGTLVALVNIAFGATLHRAAGARPGLVALASNALLAASVLLPGGFLLGGVVVYAGDPGLGVLLVPVGGALLFVATAAAFRVARHLGSPARGDSHSP